MLNFKVEVKNQYFFINLLTNIFIFSNNLIMSSLKFLYLDVKNITCNKI